jgi:phosphatidate phosphatase LPIN
MLFIGTFLDNLIQHDEHLPPGPLIISPDRMFKVLAREVIYRRAQEFKIEALRELKKLFPIACYPFYAGFGNRPSDVVSYGATGVSFN